MRRHIRSSARRWGVIATLAFLGAGVGCGESLAVLDDQGPQLPPPSASRLSMSASDGVFCCDPTLPFPQAVGTIVFRNDRNVSAPVQLLLSGGGGNLHAEPSSAEVPAGGSVTVTIYADSCALGSASMEAEEKFGAQVLQTTEIKVVEPVRWAAVRDALDYLSLFGPAGLDVQQLWNRLQSSPNGVPVLHSAATVPAQTPTQLFIEIVLQGLIEHAIGIPDLERLFGGASIAPQGGLPQLPCGAGPDGFTVCAETPALLEPGDYLTVWMTTLATIPLADPVNSYQYGFVFDADGIAANNYVPSASFPNDFFKGTDRWYEVRYAPVDGWSLVVTDARNGVLVTVASGARATIVGGSIVLAVPKSEFAVAHPAYRVTAFCHTGNFGIPPPHVWSGDLSPTVAAGLSTWTD